MSAGSLEGDPRKEHGTRQEVKSFTQTGVKTLASGNKYL